MRRGRLDDRVAQVGRAAARRRCRSARDRACRRGRRRRGTSRSRSTGTRAAPRSRVARARRAARDRDERQHVGRRLPRAALGQPEAERRHVGAGNAVADDVDDRVVRGGVAQRRPWRFGPVPPSPPLPWHHAHCASKMRWPAARSVVPAAAAGRVCANAVSGRTNVQQAECTRTRSRRLMRRIIWRLRARGSLLQSQRQREVREHRIGRRRHARRATRGRRRTAVHAGLRRIFVRFEMFGGDDGHRRRAQPGRPSSCRTRCRRGPCAKYAKPAPPMIGR